MVTVGEGCSRRNDPVQYCPVPTGVAVFLHDSLPVVRAMAERNANIVRWTEFDRGGHFAALEQPQLLVGDIRTFFRELAA